MKNLEDLYKNFLIYLETSGVWYDISKKFFELKTNQARVILVSQLDWLQHVKIRPQTRIKSSLDSEIWLDKARAAFDERSESSICSLALSYCNRSLMSAPLPSSDEHYSQKFYDALKLRITILISLSRYGAALADIELLSSSSCSILRTWALEMQVMCCTAQKEMDHTSCTCKKSGHCSRKAAVNNSCSCRNLEGKAKSDEKVNNSLWPVNNVLPEGSYQLELNSVITEMSSVPNFEAEDTDYENQDVGFPMKDICPGDIVLSDDPFSCTLFLDHVTDLCSGCFKRSDKLPSVVCPNCAMVLYCSEDCRDSSRKYHDVECPILEFFYNDEGVSNVHLLLALRTIVTAGKDFWLRVSSKPVSDISSHGKQAFDHVTRSYARLHSLKLPDGCEPWAFDLFTDTVYSVVIGNLLIFRTNFISLPLQNDENANRPMCNPEDNKLMTNWNSEDAELNTCSNLDDTELKKRCNSDDTELKTRRNCDDAELKAMLNFNSDFAKLLTGCNSDDVELSTKCNSDDAELKILAKCDDAELNTSCGFYDTELRTRCNSGDAELKVWAKYNYAELITSRNSDDKEMKTRASVLVHASTAFLTHLCNMTYYAVPIMEILQTNSSGNESDMHEPNIYCPFACGMYTKLAYLEHSCHPNAAVMFHDTKAILRAVRPIPKGRCVTINRMGNDSTWSRSESQKQFSQHYSYSCQCKACIFDWSTTSEQYDLPSLLSRNNSDFQRLLIDRSLASRFFRKMKCLSGLIHSMYCTKEGCNCTRDPHKLEDFIESFHRYVDRPYVYTVKAEIHYKEFLHGKGNKIDCSTEDRPECLSSKVFAYHRS